MGGIPPDPIPRISAGTIADLEAYVQQGNEISVAVNGATSSEAFLAAALFGSMGVGDKLKLQNSWWTWWRPAGSP